MIWLLFLGILALGWLLASLAFASLSMIQTILDIPQRILDYLRERKQRRERLRIARARREIFISGLKERNKS